MTGYLLRMREREERKRGKPSSRKRLGGRGKDGLFMELWCSMMEVRSKLLEVSRHAR